MQHNKFNTTEDRDVILTAASPKTANYIDIENANYVLYDEHQVKCFTSKRTCILTNNHMQHKFGKNLTNSSSLNRHLHLHKHYHQNHSRQLNELDEHIETATTSLTTTTTTTPQFIIPPNNSSAKQQLNLDDIELKISYACILIGFSADLEFLPAHMVNSLAENPARNLDLKENPISVNSFTHESSVFSHLFAMGPLIGDNFVRFGTGGALAIASAVWNYKRADQLEKRRQKNVLTIS
jgi:hypothetical protein